LKKIPLAIIGSGGMGHRHLSGLAELQRFGLNSYELVGVCDVNLDNAKSLAYHAKKTLNEDPTVVETIEELDILGIEAVDIATTPRHHHTITIEALRRGWHTLIEKPMCITVQACNLVRTEAAQNNVVLSIAENYRRDPINRLAKALLREKVIGTPRVLIHNSISGRNQMLISVWRHQKESCGVLVDVGVHYADMMEYLLGEVYGVCAQTRLHEPVRVNPTATASETEINGVYGRWQREMPAEFPVTAEDAVYATLVFKNGIIGQYIEDHAGHGERLWQRTIFGSEGLVELPRDRSGESIILKLDGQQPVADEKILDFVPDFQLDPITSTLFGAEQLSHYDLPFPEIDRKIIAIEFSDFAKAIRKKHAPEVDADQGTRSVAISYAMLESSVLKRFVTIDEVIGEQVDTYQREINQSLGLMYAEIESEEGKENK
jgi:predicted dehydrogenase